MKKFLTAMMVLIGIMISSTAVMAAQRDYTISVPKDYVSAKIIISFSDFREYKAVVINEKMKKEYEAVHDESEGSRKLVCNINEPVKEGEWIVRISTEQEGSGEEVVEDEEGNPVIISTDDKGIEGVNISFEGNIEKVVDVNKEIVVATDIAGLTSYFKDDSFVVEWEDTTVGNVNIEVSDEVTMEVLDKSTVSERYYELPLDPSVSSILVRIVPTVSSSMKDAEISKIIKVDNHPDADIVFENVTITNRSEINVHARLGEDYKLSFYNNNEFKKEESHEAGEYDIPFSLKNGENNLKIYVIDKNGNMRSTSWTVIQDTIAPVLELKSQYQGVSTESEAVTIEGKVQDYSTFQINDVDVKVEGDHTFAYKYELKEGLNQINLVAVDEAGNVTSYAASITRVIPEPPKVPVEKYILLGIIILGILIFIAITVKNHFFTYEYEEDEEEDDDEEDEEEEETEEEEERQSFFDKAKSKLKRSEAERVMEKPVRSKPEKDMDGAKKAKALRDIFLDYLPDALIVIVFVIIITKVIMIATIESGSMEPTLGVGNTVVYNRLAYLGDKEPQRGDIVAFYSDEFGVGFGKRVMGIPGDEISFRDGYLVINGQLVDESDYLDGEVQTLCDKTFKVPDGCYFMLGDNRMNSLDSRFWENPYISKDKLRGKYMGKINFSFKYDVWYKIVGQPQKAE